MAGILAVEILLFSFKWLHLFREIRRWDLVGAIFKRLWFEFGRVGRSSDEETEGTKASMEKRKGGSQTGSVCLGGFSVANPHGSDSEV